MFRETFATNVFGIVALTEALLPLLRASKAGRVVNVSSTVGSLEAQSNPESPWFSMLVPAYQSSKAALNSVTIELAKTLADTTIKVSAVCPGWVQTNLAPGNFVNAPLTADEAAQVVVAAATLPASAESGRFFDNDGPVAW
jgi:NAD(P)-dependent dehydrogenase (short-subunit alcohol dehydrogenase family)